MLIVEDALGYQKITDTLARCCRSLKDLRFPGSDHFAISLDKLKSRFAWIQLEVGLVDDFNDRFVEKRSACRIDHQVSTSQVFDKDRVTGSFNHRIQDAVAFAQRFLGPFTLQSQRNLAAH